MAVSDCKLLIFDCDGTLTDSQGGIIAAMHAAFASYELPTPAAMDIKKLVGLPLPDVMLKLLGEGAEIALIEGLMRKFRELSHDPVFVLKHQIMLFEGCRELLERCHKEDYSMGIVTGMGRRGLFQTVEDMEISHFFESLKSADDGPGKPNPDLLQDVMLECGADAQNAIMIGDTSYDIQAGHNANMYTIGVTWGNHSEAHLRASGADEIASDFDQLYCHIHRYFAG